MRRRLLVGGFALLLVVVSAIAFALVGSPGVITGCVDELTGALRIRQSGQCEPGESKFTWNRVVPASSPNEGTSCPEGQLVIGFEQDGSMVCAAAIAMDETRPT